MHIFTLAEKKALSFAKNKIKAVLTLYGEGDSGKTATLRYLYKLLSGQAPINQNPKDFRARLDYCGVRILISTTGDDKKDVEDNWHWYLGLYKATANRTRTLGDANISDVDKVIIVGPTRESGKNDGVILNDGFIQELKSSLSVIQYIHKTKIEASHAPDAIPEEEQFILGNLNRGQAEDAKNTAEYIKACIDEIIRFI